MNEIQTAEKRELQATESELKILSDITRKFAEENGMAADNLPENFFDEVAQNLLKTEIGRNFIQDSRMPIEQLLNNALKKKDVQKASACFPLLMEKALNDEKTMSELLPFFNDRDSRSPTFENKELKNAINKPQIDCMALYNARKLSDSTESQNLNILRIKSKYSGIQALLEGLGKCGCYFLNLCTIIEEVTGKPLDIIETVRDSIANGWIDMDNSYHIGKDESLSILSKYTEKKWKAYCAAELPSSPSILKDNVFIIESWLVCDQNFYKTVHTTRYFVDVSDEAEQKNIGLHLNYMIFEYEK